MNSIFKAFLLPLFIHFYSFLRCHQVGNLWYASPATVSRAGMVYVDPKNLRYSPYWQRWILTRPEVERELLAVSVYDFLKQEFHKHM